MAQYRKKPVVIEAMQWMGPELALIDATRAVAFDEWLASKQGDRKCIYRGDTIIIPTLEGEMRAGPWDWIICGVAGEIYPCKPEIFEATYEPA